MHDRPLANEIVDGHQAGPGDEVDLGGDIVDRQQPVEVGVDGHLVGCAVTQERLTQRLGDPLRVRVPDSERGRDVAIGRRDGVQPGVEVPLTDPAHHGIDQTGSPGTIDLPGQRNGGVGSRVDRHPHTQQLVRAEPQRVEHSPVDPGDWPVGGNLDDRVVDTAQSRCAIGHFGGECRIAAAQAPPPQLVWEFEIGVAAVSNPAHHGVCREPRRIARPAPLAGAGGRAPAAVRPPSVPFTPAAALAWPAARCLTHEARA